MGNEELIKRYEQELSILEQLGTVSTDNLDTSDKMGERIYNLITDFNNENESRKNQLQLILSNLKKLDGDDDV